MPKAQPSSLLRYLHSVACRLDVPERHHGVVFVHHVMAMDGVLAQPVAEAEEEFHALVRTQLRHILAGSFDQRRRNPVAAHNLMLFQVDVDGVRPIAGKVAEDQCSTLFCCTVKRKLSEKPLGPIPQSMNWPLMDHWPFNRSNLKVRTTRAAAVLSGSE